MSPRPPSQPAVRPRRASAGFTLVEVVTAAVVGFVTIGLLFALTSTTSRAARDVGGNLRTLQASIAALASVRADFKRCRVESVAQDGSSVTYSLPVRGGPGGSVLDEAGEVVWGVEDHTGIEVGGTITLAFEKESTLSEADVGQDLNRDGDQTDVFEVGRLRRTSDKGTRLTVPRLDLVLLSGDRKADLDRDGEADPLFALDDAHEELVMRLARFDTGKGVRVFATRSRVAAIDTSAKPGAPAQDAP